MKLNSQLGKDPKWIDFGDPRIEHKFTDKEMIEHFDKCTSPYRAIDNNKFYYCHMNTSAVRAKILKTNDKNNYIDLKERLTKKKFYFSILVLFLMVILVIVKDVMAVTLVLIFQ